MVEYYLLETWGSSSRLHGPYESEAIRDQAGLARLSLPDTDSDWLKVDIEDGRWDVYGFVVKETVDD